MGRGNLMTLHSAMRSIFCVHAKSALSLLLMGFGLEMRPLLLSAEPEPEAEPEACLPRTPEPDGILLCCFLDPMGKGVEWFE